MFSLYTFVFHSVNNILFLSSMTLVNGLEFKFALRLKVDNDNLYIAESHISLYGIDDCIESCKRRTKCKFINYQPRSNLCQMINKVDGQNFSTIDYLEIAPGYYFWDKSWWDTTEQNMYEEGLTEEEGKTTSNVNSGCGLPEHKEHAVVYGNMFSFGDKIQYKCIDEFTSNMNVPLTSTCLDNGTWTEIDVTCVRGEVRNIGRTYYMLIPDRKPWEEANLMCKSIGWELVSIKSREEQRNITRLITESKDWDNYWTGGVRIGNENRFKWTDGTSLPISDLDWMNRQPNDVAGNQDCIRIDKHAEFRLNDYFCSTSNKCICKKNFSISERVDPYSN